MKAPLLAGWTALALIATGLSQDRATLITQLKGAVEAELQASDTTKREKAGETSAEREFRRAASQLQLLPPNPSDAQLRQVIGNLHPSASKEDTRKAAEALNSFLQKEAQTQNQLSVEEMDAVGKRIAAVGLSAKTSKELDAPIAELTKLMSEGGPATDFEAGFHAFSRAGVVRLQPLLGWLQARQEYLVQREAGNRKAARQILQRQTGVDASLSPWIPRSELLALQDSDLKAVTPSPEEAQQEATARIARIAELCRKLLAADDAKVVDPVLQELGELQKVDYADGNTAEARQVQEAANSTREFARRWQDFLIAREAGEYEAALSVVSEIIRGGRDYSGVPRSEILARAYSEQAALRAERAKPNKHVVEAEKILEQMTTIEAMERLLPKLEIALETTQDSDLRSTVAALQGLSRSYSDFKAAGANGVSLPVFRMGSNTGVVKRLREQLALLMIPPLLDLEPTDLPKPDESGATYIHRLLTAACEKQNWEMATRLFTIPQDFGLDDVPNRAWDRSAISHFRSGIKLEETKQYALAVNAYQLALRTGSDLVPSKEIGERLEAIKNSHPEEYRLGTERTLTLPTPPTPSRTPPGSLPRR